MLHLFRSFELTERSSLVMKLFYAPGVCSLSPHIVLKESGLPFEAIKTDIRAKTVDGGGDYKKTNPLGYVPALGLDDGTILTEGPAIVQYVADQVPEKKLAPANGTLDRYKMQSWLNFLSSELHKGFSPLFTPGMPDEAKTMAKDRLATRFAHLDAHFAKHDYLMGAAFSCPDAYCFTVLRWTVPQKIDLAPYPHVQAFMARMAERPAVQAALKAEGLAA
jgi:glutathione S-transferase